MVVFKSSWVYNGIDLNERMEQETEQKLIESVVVVEIDPTLTLFKPSCIHLPMPVRIEMGFES